MESLIIEALEEIYDNDEEGISFMKLLGAIKSLSKNKPSDWMKLRAILNALIEDGLIEERHALGGEDKKVDYTIENKGIDFLANMRLEHKIKKSGKHKILQMNE